jgi:hypothetical protein
MEKTFGYRIIIAVPLASHAGDHLEGYIWAENFGWIRLGTHTSGSPHTYANTVAANYGVNRDQSGSLSGWEFINIFTPIMRRRPGDL